MAAAGFDYLAPTDDELIALSGDWEPHPILGIRRQGAARRVGYHPAELGGLGTATQAAQLDAMELDQRERYLEALVSYDDGLPPVEIERPDGQPATMSRAQGSGCLLDAEAAFEDTAGHWAVVEEASSDGSEPAAEEVGRDQQVGEALAAWAGCVQAAVGVEASTPDELARRYAFIERVGADGQVAADVTPLADEIEVAVVDARCQTETGLQATWFAADAAAVRARLGADAVHYDDLTRLQIANVATARQILEERGIEPPSLD
jgi:hypothetical protein